MTAQAALSFALAYAEHGLPVIPVYGFSEGSCECRKACGSPAKHPRTEHGLNDATIDADVIRGWWQRWPTANVGVVIPPGYVALDVDVEDVSTALEGRELPTTATSRTSRGYQFLYRTTRDVRPAVGVLPKVDVRGPGSYIVAPPSVHASGHEYVWVSPPRDGIAEAPAWLYDLAGEPRVNGTAAPGEPIPEGKRESTLISLAGSMRAKGFGESAIVAALRVENGRCVPPLADDDLQRLARSAARYEPEQAGPVLTVGEPVERPQAHPAAVVDTAAAVADTWLVEGVWRPGRMGVIASQEGVGKSQARIEAAIRLATGSGALFGHYPIPAPARVLLFDVENGEDEETRREEDVLARLELRREQLAGYWRVSLEGLLLTDKDDQTYVASEIERVRPAVAIFDTGSSMVGDEWGKELKLAVRFLRRLAREYGCAVVVCVHLVKPARDGRRGKDAPVHGTEITDVMGQWTRQADSVALMARTKDEHVVWTMRKRVPRSTLVLAPAEGIFTRITAAVGGELGADVREKVRQQLAAGMTDTGAIAQLLGITRRTVQRHVARLKTGPASVSPPVAAPVAGSHAQETTPLSPPVAENPVAQSGDVATVSSPPIRGDAGDMSPTVVAAGNALVPATPWNTSAMVPRSRVDA